MVFLTDSRVDLHVLMLCLLDGRRMAWSTGANEVTINHLNGTCNVAYDTSQWLAQAKESQLTRVSGTLLQDSTK